MRQDQTENPHLSVIIPAFNEERRLGPTLQLIREYAASHNLRAEVIVVDDGSTDGTAALVKQFEANDLQVRLLANEGNRGKGYSVRRGMIEARGEMRLLSDADMSTPIEQVDKLARFLAQGFDVVIGSRSMPDSQLDPPQPPVRRVLNILFRIVRGAIMLPDISDTQCGFKLFSGRAAEAVFALARSDGFAFDCEVLGIARKLGYRIREVGVLWRDDRASTVRPMRIAVPMLIALWRIRRRLNRMKATSPAAVSAASPR